jgi:RNA polymerase sigma factor (sigma-70 family)
MTGNPSVPESDAALDPIERLAASGELAYQAEPYDRGYGSVRRIGLAVPPVSVEEEVEPSAPQVAQRPRRGPSLSPEEAAMLVGAAAGGDRGAWDALVDAYSGLIWTVARNHRLSSGDAGDVSQTTWLRLVENIDRISEPSRVGAWLATTARRECLRLLGRSKRTVLSGEELDPASDRLRLATPEADTALLAAERDKEVRQAFTQLTPRCRELLQLLLLDPAPSYDEIAAALDIPVGSIGPTRGRCLEKLRGIIGATAGINVPDPGSL